MAREVAARLPAEASEQNKLDALRKFLFEENGFHGSRGDYYNRANSYLNEVLDDREGLPITLSIVYIELARKVGLNVVGVGLPGHFVVRHIPAQGESQLIDVYDAARGGKPRGGQSPRERGHRARSEGRRPGGHDQAGDYWPHVE